MSAVVVTIEDLTSDPHPHLARLRDSAPVVFVPAIDGYLVVGRDAAVQVMRDAATFTVADPRFSTAQVVGPSMLSLDGAEHSRHRAPFVAPFRPRHVAERFAERVEAQVRGRIDAIAASPDRTAELRSALAGPVAATVVAYSIGLDGDDDGMVDRLLGWYREIVGSVSGVGAGRPVTAEGAAAMQELGETLRRHLSGSKVDSLLAEAAAAGGLSIDEVVSNAAVIMFGGIETTEAMILNALWFLLPSAWRPPTLDRDSVAAAVEESLRLEPAAAVVDRYATQDARVAGVSIPAGSFVEVSLAAANRDPAEFPDPDRFDPSRPNLRRQLAFATGPHVCIGMDLARLETCVAVVELLARLPTIHIAPDSPPPTGLVFRKPARLDVAW